MKKLKLEELKSEEYVCIVLKSDSSCDWCNEQASDENPLVRSPLSKDINVSIMERVIDDKKVKDIRGVKDWHYNFFGQRVIVGDIDYNGSMISTYDLKYENKSKTVTITNFDICKNCINQLAKLLK